MLVIVAIVVIVCTAGAALGPLATILVGAAKGLLIGALMGGLSAWAAGGSFSDILKGFEDGAFTGAITGALMGGLGGLGQVSGKGIQCLSALGKTISVVSKVSGALSVTMGGFDMLAFGAGLVFGQDNFLTSFNTKLHFNKFYNAFQIGVSALAIFFAGAASAMTSFVAGTMVLTASGVVAIENIKAGDWVISTNLQTAEKEVVETYVRESALLTHIWIDGKETKVTPDHPYWVHQKGWVNAGELVAGDQLRKPDGELVSIQKIEIEKMDVPATVYNFQVEGFHTYYAGSICVLVHNAEYQNAPYHTNRDSGRKNKAPSNGQQALDDSLPLGNNTNRRIGISDNEFVVLDQTSGGAFPNGVFHGHVRSWGELTSKMQAVLRKAGLVTKGGGKSYDKIFNPIQWCKFRINC